MALFVFGLFGLLAVLFAVLSVTRRNPVYAAFFLLLTLGALAVEFLLLHGPFIAAMQIILYAGAIVVLFVFVIMLLSLREEELGPEPDAKTRLMAGMIAGAVFLLLSYPVFKDPYLARGMEGKAFRPLQITVELDTVLSAVSSRHGLTVRDLTTPAADRVIQPSLLGPDAAAVNTRMNTAQADAIYLCSRLCEVNNDELGKTLGLSSEQFAEKVSTVKAAVESKDAGYAASQNRLAALEKRIRVRSDRFGSLEQFVDFLYTRYVVAFELISVLIFAAIAGVIVLARRRGFMGLETEDGETRSGGMFL